MIPGIIQFNKHRLMTYPTTYPYVSSMSMWFDASDTSKTIITSGRCVSIQCKATGIVWSSPDASNGPVVDDTLTNLKGRCLNFDYFIGSINKRLQGQAIPLQSTYSGPMTVFMVSKFNSIDSYATLALQHGVSSTALQSGLGAPSIFRFKSPPGGGVQVVGGGNSYSWSPTSYDDGVFTAIIPNTTPSSTILRYKSTDLTENNGGSGYLPTWTPTLLGSSDSLYRSAGYFAELIVYNRVLTQTEIIEIEAALTAKWII